MSFETVHQIQYGNTTIHFILNFSERKTLAISVYPDMKILVTAPQNSTIEKILSKVEKRAAWIQKQIRKFSALGKPFHQPEYVSGETFQYLGRKYRLRISLGTPGVILKGKFFLLTIPNKGDKVHPKKIMDVWYEAHSRERLIERFENHKKIFQREKIKFDHLIIRRMEKRWGSCTEKGNIILNPELIRVPIDCIDYVIIHEICHLKFLNHSSKFYRLLSKYVPDWERKKKKLERF